LLKDKKEEPKPLQPGEKVEFGYGEGNINTYNDTEVFKPEEDNVEEANLALESNIAP
jgi:hypothetical protein